MENDDDSVADDDGDADDDDSDRDDIHDDHYERMVPVVIWSWWQ